MTGDDPYATATSAAAICTRAVRQLGLSGGGVSVISGSGHRGTVFSTDAVAAAIEELQFTLGEGPCVDAFHRGPVLIDDLVAVRRASGDPWPLFTAAAFAAGARALFAFPLQVGAIRIGAMDLYRDRSGALDEAQLAGALVAADDVAAAIVDDHGRGSDGPLGAGDGSWSHAEVHQASGMLSVQLAISVEDAFVWLRARAFASGRSVAQLAREVVAGVLHVEPESRGSDDRN